MGISTMRRIKDTDTLMIGTNGSLFVVKFEYARMDSCGFKLLAVVPNIHSWLITSIDYYTEGDTT
jgi:hypothetical protein